MRALDTGEHTDTTLLAAWQIDLGAWWVIDSDSSGRLSCPACECVCERECQGVRLTEKERESEMDWEKKDTVTRAADDEEGEKKYWTSPGKVIVGNLRWESRFKHQNFQAGKCLPHRVIWYWCGQWCMCACLGVAVSIHNVSLHRLCLTCIIVVYRNCQIATEHTLQRLKRYRDARDINKGIRCLCIYTVERCWFLLFHGKMYGKKLY